jgi:hypothetical protein
MSVCFATVGGGCGVRGIEAGNVETACDGNHNLLLKNELIVFNGVPHRERTSPAL